MGLRHARLRVEVFFEASLWLARYGWIRLDRGAGKEKSTRFAMIVRISGTYIESQPMGLVIDVNGLAYEVQTPLSTLSALPALGNQVALHTVLIVREDAHTLYGFHTQQLRHLFKLLVEKVSGIGPKIALGILSHISTELLTQAIEEGSPDLLTQCPGIGKKTAQRLILELQSIMRKQSLEWQAIESMPLNARQSVLDEAIPQRAALSQKRALPEPISGHQTALPVDAAQSDPALFSASDAIRALIALGYPLAQADERIRKALGKAQVPPESTEALIRLALKG